ncbi:MAG: ribose-phosphate diphosphokinase [Burkholderiales bacterium]|nr:ribose-phosphate diphosphokinase [Burkholderiales bacterium]
MSDTLVLYFDDERETACRFAETAGFTSAVVNRHRFPDGELKLRLPASLPAKVIVYRSLVHPNEKLIELLFVAQTARQLGASDLTLIAPYLAYMRQDIAFHEGEVVSQKVIGRFLAQVFDGLVTIDPHLHRVSTLEEASPVKRAITLSGAPLLGDYIAQKIPDAFLLGPDSESSQWIASAAKKHGFDHAACEKIRRGDKDVQVQLPAVDLKDRRVVILDDVASSGRTLAKATRAAIEAGASSVDVAVTHALFADDALQVIREAGVRHIWSTDCIAHESNVVSIAAILAEALQ